MARLLRALALMSVVVSPAAAGQEPATQPAVPLPVGEEQVVVTASKTDQTLVNVPASVTVVTGEAIQRSPGTSIGDVLRTVPGLNVSQTSARDVNLTSRAATTTLATSQLALVDGRSIYLDFFGMVLWEFVPANMHEIKQIEVIRGPASAVWGANALAGVVNVVTKSPRELAAEGGTTMTIGVGSFDRNVTGRRQDAGMFFQVHGSHAVAVDDRWAFKLSAGYRAQDPLPRPAGTIANPFQTPYPAYANQGTVQPKVDARVDYDFTNGGTLTVGGGLTGTRGIIHTGVGPFDIGDASRMGYVTARYANEGTRIAFFTNLLDGRADSLLSMDPGGRPLALVFGTRTFDVEASDQRRLGTRHLFRYGGNFRHNAFDVSLAPDGADRREGGAYIQDEIFLGDHVRWLVGGRVDKFSSMAGAVASPRTTFIVKPAAAHALRASYNRAFRAPSFSNNYLDTAVVSRLSLGLINPALAGATYDLPVRAVGNPDLKPEMLTAYELGYTGVFGGRATIGAAVYWTGMKDVVQFTQVARYSAAAPPSGWPLPPAVLDGLAAAGAPLPSQLSYRNIGTVKNKGIELGVEGPMSQGLDAFANYSYQWTPVTVGFPSNEINRPPAHRFNAGVHIGAGRWLGTISVSRTSDAFWQDVLDARFAGTTEAYTLLNGAVSLRWAGNRVKTSLKATNLTNVEAMQHIFGDVIRRQIVAELGFIF